MSDAPDPAEPGGAAWESDPVPVLQRWEASGAVWRVHGRSDEQVTIGLFTCDGGEQVAVFRCAAGAVDPVLQGRDSNAG